jgi:hypothetical protein
LSPSVQSEGRLPGVSAATQGLRCPTDLRRSSARYQATLLRFKERRLPSVRVVREIREQDWMEVATMLPSTEKFAGEARDIVEHVAVVVLIEQAAD